MNEYDEEQNQLAINKESELSMDTTDEAEYDGTSTLFGDTDDINFKSTKSKSNPNESIDLNENNDKLAELNEQTEPVSHILSLGLNTFDEVKKTSPLEVQDDVDDSEVNDFLTGGKKKNKQNSDDVYSASL